MPSVSTKQHNYMEMIAHDPKAAKREGVPQSVGSEFVQADKKAGKYAEGGAVKGGLTPAPPEFIARLQQHGLTTPEEIERALNSVGHTHMAHLAGGGEPTIQAPDTEHPVPGMDNPFNQTAPVEASMTPSIPPETAPGAGQNATPTAWTGAPMQNAGEATYNPYETARMRMNTAEGMVPGQPDLKAPDYTGEQAATKTAGEAQAAQVQQVGTAQQSQAQRYAELVRTQTEAEKETQTKITNAMNIAKSDPRQSWSGAKHVTAGIAAVLGGIGAALTHSGQNVAVNILENQINRQVGLNKDFVTHLEQQYGDTHQANLAARLAFRDNAITEIDALKNSTQSAVVRANADLAIKQLQVKQQVDTNAIHQNIFLDKMEGAKLATEQGRFMLQYSQGLMQRTVMDHGKPIIAPDEAAATDARGFIATQDRVTQSANNLIQLARQGRAVPYTERAAKMEQLTATIQDDWRQLQHSGVFKESELSFIKGIADNPASLTNINPQASMAKLRELGVIMERAKQAKLSTWPGYQGSGKPNLPPPRGIGMPTNG